MRRIFRAPVLAGLIAALVAVLFVASTANPAVGQSPMFPNNQPIPRQLFREFPARGVRIDDRWGPVVSPQVIVIGRSRPGPSAYPNIPGYGTSPFIRVYGGAGSTYQTPAPDPWP